MGNSSFVPFYYSTTNRIQISSDTAELLVASNKQHWITAREDKVSAKGKGLLSTFWLNVSGSDNRTASSGSDSLDNLSGHTDTRGAASERKKRIRVADWTAEILAALLQEIDTRRVTLGIKRDPNWEDIGQEGSTRSKGNVINEVEEIITLPEVDLEKEMEKIKASKLTTDVNDELRQYVRCIALMYRDNRKSISKSIAFCLLDFRTHSVASSILSACAAFHNFAHANHVTMSVCKLMSRIVAPDVDDMENKSLHDHTYGITSDPLTRFAVVFSALIHDADHTGVSNAQLVKEKTQLAIDYKNKSVAEQNSVDLAWGEFFVYMMLATHPDS